MRIEKHYAAAPAGSVSAGRSTGAASGFTLAGNAPAASTTGMGPAAPLAGLDAILTLQAGEDPPQERRRRSVARGHDLLDGLDRLKAAILGGRVATHELQTIAKRLAERARASGDPRLDGLLAEIELRAAVELAKLAAARGIVA